MVGTSFSCDKSVDMINWAGGGPLQAFCRSSTTFTSALLWSSKFYPYIRVGLRDKVMAAPRLNVAGLSLYSTHLFLIMLTSFYDLPLFHLSGFCARVGESGYTFFGFGETNCSYLRNITDLTYFPFLRGRTFTVRPCLKVLYQKSWWLPPKKQARSIVFCPSSDQQIPREKMDCFL